MPDGRIQDEFVTRLNAIGAWMKVNGDAIYGTTASPFARLPFFGRVTAKGNKLYLHVFEWPASGVLRVPNLHNLVHSAALVVAPEARLGTRRDGDDVLVTLPAEAPDPVASVVVLTLDGVPVVGPFTNRADEKGVIALGVESCEIETKFGQRAKLENILGHVFLTKWERPDDVPTWKMKVSQAGRYKVDLVYGSSRRSEGTEYTITAGANQLTGKVARGPNNWVFKSHAVGEMPLAAGEQTLQVKMKTQNGVEAMTLEKVILTRVE
jgi:alpha-L-fucosidase